MARGRRILKILAVAVVVLVLLLVVAWVFRAPLFGPLLQRTIEGQLASNVGGTWEVGKIGGSWISDVEIDGVRQVEAGEAGMIRSAEVARIAASYSLWGLLVKGKGLGAIHSVNVENARLELEPGLAPPSPEEEAPGTLPDLGTPPAHFEMPDVTVTGSIGVQLEGTRLELGRLVIRTVAPHALEVVVEDVAVGEEPELVEGAIRGRLEQAPSGALTWHSETTLAGLGLPTADWLEDGRVDAALETGGGRIDVRMAKGEAQLSAPRIDIEKLPAWIRELVPPSVPLPLSGRIEARAVLHDLDGRAGLGADFDVTLRELRWKTHILSRLVARGKTTASGVIELEQVEAEAEGSRATLLGIRLDPSLPTFLLSAERIQVEVPDLQHWLPDLTTPLAFRMDAVGENATSLVLSTFEVKAPWGRAEGKGRLVLPGTPERWRETTFDLELTFDAEAPTDMADRVEGALGGTAKAKGNLDDLILTLDLEGRDAKVAGVPIDGAAARAVVHWPRAELETLTIRSPVAKAEGRAVLVLDPFEVPEIQLTGEAPDLGVLAGYLDQGDMELGGRASFEVTGRVPVSGEPHVVLQADLTDITKGEDALGHARLEATLDAERVELHTVQAQGPWGEATARGTFDLESQIFELEGLDAEGTWGRAATTGTVDLQAKRARIGALEAEAGDTEIRLASPLEVSFADGRIVADDLDVAIGDGRLQADLSADLDGKEATIGRLSWTPPEDEEDASRAVRLLEPLVVRWDDELVVRVAPIRVSLPGDVELDTRILVRVEDQEAIVEALRAKGSFGEASLTRPLHVAFEDSRVSILGLEVQLDDLTASAEAEVFLDEARALVPALRVRKGKIDAKLARTLTLRKTERGFALEDLDVALGEGARVTGHATWEDALTADLVLEGLELSEWVPSVSGTASGKVEVRGEQGRVEVQVAGLSWQHLQGEARLVLEQGKEGGLTLETLSLQGADRLLVQGSAATPFRLGTGGIERLEGQEEHFALRGRVPLPEGVEAEPLRIDLAGDASGIRARLGVVGHWLEGEDKADDVTFLLDVTPSEVVASVEPKSNEVLEVEGRVRVDRGFDWTRPETLEGFLDGNVSGRFVATLGDWRPIADLVGGFRKLEGSLHLEASVKGTVRAPVPEVVARVEDVYVEREGGLPAITDLHGSLRYADRRLDIQGLKGEIGYGPFEIGGYVALPEGGELEADVRLKGDYLLLARAEGIRVRANLDLALQGTWPDAVLRGDVDIADVYYTKPFSLPSGGDDDEGSGTSTAASACGGGREAPPSATGISIPGIEAEPLASLKLDVGIRAKNNIRVRMNLLNANIDVDMRVGGTAREPEPVGKIGTRGATVFLPTTTLTVEGAEITFPPGAPTRPRVNAMVRTMSSGYDVGANAQGVLPNVELSVWSRPRLSDADAMMMLVTGSAGGGISGLAFESLVGLFGDTLLSFAKGTADPEARPFFDRFTMRVGRFVSRRGRDTIEAEARVAGKLHVYVERDRYDASNLGFIWRVPLR